MRTVLALGSYSETDHSALLDQFDPIEVAEIAQLSQVPAESLAGVRAVAFKGHSPFDGATMDLMPNLGLIANYGVGYDAIDTEAAAARQIAVTNTPDVLNDDVADLAVAMLLAYGRDMVRGDAWVRDGTWATGRDLPLNRKISGGRAGILGLGRIGREIADRLAAFKMEIHYTSRAPKQVPDNWHYHSDAVALAGAVDYLVVALVGGAATQGMVSKNVIKALGPRGILVNISRGSTVDEAALLDALESGELGGAALDVFLNEPGIDPRFLGLTNVHLQPHQGSATHETRAAMGQLQRDNIAAFLAGNALVTPV